VLILDEATSSLDSITEQAIQDALATVMRGKTVLVVAHRLSTIANLDRILVFDAGRIVEDGTHAQLLAKRGAYFALWSRQSHGFLSDGLEAATDDASEVAALSAARDGRASQMPHGETGTRTIEARASAREQSPDTSGRDDKSLLPSFPELVES
jgi:ATP-binding cassette subfamily B protein